MTRGETETGGDRETHAQGASRGIEEREALDGVGMSVDGGIDRAKRGSIGHGHRTEIAVLADADAEIGASGVHDGNRVPFGKHEPIGACVLRMGGNPAHGVVHQNGDDVAQTHRMSGDQHPLRR